MPVAGGVRLPLSEFSFARVLTKAVLRKDEPIIKGII